MEQIARLITSLIPDVIFTWRRHLRSVRGADPGGATGQEQLSNCLKLILSEVGTAVSTGKFDIDICADAARRFGRIRHQHQAKATDLIREIRILRTGLWNAVTASAEIDPASQLSAQAKSEAVFDEVIASSVDSLLERVKADTTEYDPLTSLYSRTLFHRELEIELQRSARFRRRFALIMVSLQITLPPDANTHEAFDCVISDVARLLKDKLRRSDRMFRYDNTQFSLLCPETDSGGLQTLCHRIALDVSQYRQRTGLDVDVQYGTAGYPSDAQNSLSLIRVALADQSFHQTGIEC
ncbi:MAG TPA: diguanylate cyclase [Blastocatellia bacterium]|nr:diguanylate cyclase [Blastocatellia bacterium]